MNAVEIDQFNEHLPMETKHKANLALLAIVAAGLLAVPPETQAQQDPPEERENYVWITKTNGSTQKKDIWGSTRSSFYFDPSDGFDKREIAQIVVPEHAIISSINVEGCVNLTNIVIQPAEARTIHNGRVVGGQKLNIAARRSGLLNITCSKAMRDALWLSRGDPRGEGWWPIYWTELELPKVEIRTHATANGTEVEVVWRDGKLQIADAVNGEYRDHLGSSPLRFPLAAAKDKQFFRIARIESPTTEEPPTPQTSGGGR